MGSASRRGSRPRSAPPMAGVRRFARAVRRRLAARDLLPTTWREIHRGLGLRHMSPLLRGSSMHPLSDPSVFGIGKGFIPQRLHAPPGLSLVRARSAGRVRPPVRSRISIARWARRMVAAPHRLVAGWTPYEEVEGPATSQSRNDGWFAPGSPPLVREWPRHQHAGSPRPMSPVRPLPRRPYPAVEPSMPAHRRLRSADRWPLEPPRPLSVWARPLAMAMNRAVEHQFPRASQSGGPVDRVALTPIGGSPSRGFGRRPSPMSHDWAEASPRAREFIRSVERWPLERPRPLSVWARPLAKAILGSNRIPSVTIGPNTRRALHAAGALAASSGGVLHFPASPEATPRGLGIVAHELSHAAHPRPTATLFLDDVISSGEDRARAVGEEVRARAETMGSMGRKSPERAVGYAVPEMSVSSLPVGGPRTGLFGAGPGVIDDVVQQARRLPAGGLVNSATSGAVGDAPRAGADTSSPVPAVTHVEDVMDIAGGSAGVVSDARVVGAEGDTAVNRSVERSSSAATDPHSQLGELMEALEERVIADLERRGGRFAGVF
jgi:hypothetical protein